MGLIDEFVLVLGGMVDTNGLNKKMQDSIEGLLLALASAGVPSCDALTTALEQVFSHSLLCSLVRNERNVVQLALACADNANMAGVCRVASRYICVFYWSLRSSPVVNPPSPN